MIVLFPADLLRPRRPDDHFTPEADAARAAGHQVAVIDHDTLARGGDAGEAVRRVPSGSGEAVYRGWMLRSEQYAALATALADRGVTLRTGAAEYRQAHELPGWYAALAAVTPESVWTDGGDRDAFGRACARLAPGAAVLRDYCKSAKHHWHEAVYLPDVADTDAAWKVASRFRELRGDDFTGGFVLRRYEDLTGAEVRTWWVGGVCRLVTAHPDTADRLPPPDLDLAEVAPLVGGLGLPFVTADLALRADGRWRLVEVGDGQVSDRPASAAPETFLEAIIPGEA